MASVAHLDAFPRARGGVGSRVKLALVDALLGEREVRPCAVLVLRWLSRHAGIERAVCAVVDADGGRLSGLTGLGVGLTSVDSIQIDLADRAHPLVVALGEASPSSSPTPAARCGGPSRPRWATPRSMPCR